MSGSCGGEEADDAPEPGESPGQQLWLSASATLVLAEVEAAVQLVLGVSGVGLTGDRGGSAVGQRTPHLLVLGLLRGSIHAVELWSAWRGQQRAGEDIINREIPPVKKSQLKISLMLNCHILVKFTFSFL